MSKTLESIRVPYGMSVHGEEEIAAVNKVLRTSTQMGANVREFEALVSGLFDKRYGIMVNSGSSALLLGAEILGLPDRSEVVTPVLTFSTTVSSILKSSLVPTFVDVEQATYCIDPDRIEQAITSSTKVLLVPNLIGNVAQWDRIAEIARQHNLIIMEDSADTIGATFDGRSTGAYSDISITSFYGSHVINCAGNGGMLCVNDDEWARRAKLLRSWGRSSALVEQSESSENRFNVSLDGIEYDAKFVFEALGYNFEPSEAGAAFGLVQLQKLGDIVEARIRNFQVQLEFFGQYEDWFVLPSQTPKSRSAWLAFPLTIRPEAPFTRRELQIFLEHRNIQTRVIFTGNITRQPAFQDTPMRKSDHGYPVADRVSAGGILLACHHGLTHPMLAHIHESFTEFALRF